MLKEAQLEKLNDNGLVILQPKNGYRFSIDAVLLARFVKLKKGNKIIDLGTGSGVIPLLLTTREKELNILGIELQKELVELAKESVNLNNLNENIGIINKDIRALSISYNGKYDLVISNPPFFKKNSGKISKNIIDAIARHELYCNLEDIISKASKLMKSNGSFALIHRPERLYEFLCLCKEYKLVPNRLCFVHPNMNKDATMFLIEVIKGTRGTMKVIEPLFVYDEFGNYTKRMADIFAGETI